MSDGDLVKRAREAYLDSSEQTYKLAIIRELADCVEELIAEKGRMLRVLHEITSTRKDIFNTFFSPLREGETIRQAALAHAIAAVSAVEGDKRTRRAALDAILNLSTLNPKDNSHD